MAPALELGTDKKGLRESCRASPKRKLEQIISMICKYSMKYLETRYCLHICSAGWVSRVVIRVLRQGFTTPKFLGIAPGVAPGISPALRGRSITPLSSARVLHLISTLIQWVCSMCHSGPHWYIFECKYCKLKTCRPCTNKV